MSDKPKSVRLAGWEPWDGVIVGEERITERTRDLVAELRSRPLPDDPDIDTEGSSLSGDTLITASMDSEGRVTVMLSTVRRHMVLGPTKEGE